MKKLTVSTLTIAALLGVLPSAAQACNSCMGAPDSNLAPALAGAIITLVVLLTGVGAAFLKFVFFLAKCDAASSQAEMPRG